MDSCARILVLVATRIACLYWFLTATSHACIGFQRTTRRGRNGFMRTHASIGFRGLGFNGGFIIGCVALVAGRSHWLRVWRDLGTKLLRRVPTIFGSMKLYPIFEKRPAKRPAKGKEFLIDAFIPDDREFAEFELGMVGIGLGPTRMSAKIRTQEVERHLVRSLRTSGRYEGDQDFEYFQKKTSWSSTRSGGRPRGWSGSPKWGYSLANIYTTLRVSMRIARREKRLRYFEARVRDLRNSSSGSYGRYRHLRRRRRMTRT